MLCQRIIAFRDIAPCGFTKAVKQTNISEVCTASNIRAMMEAVCTPKMSIYFKETTKRYMSEDCNLHAHNHENLKSQKLCHVTVVYLMRLSIAQTTHTALDDMING
jgi:hypothetical protein